MKGWTRMAWLSITDKSMHDFALFDRIVSLAHIRQLAAFDMGAAHHVTVVKRVRRRRRYYIDGKRVSRRHPFLRAARSKPYPREILGL